MRLEPVAAERLDRLTERLPMSRSALLREALALGLELLEADPARIVRPALGGEA